MDIAVDGAAKRVESLALATATDAIPAAALEAATRSLLDTVGVAAGAAGMQAGRIAADVACQIYGVGPGGEIAHVLFDGRAASLPGAAFAGATQIDNLDGHDGYNPTKGHIGCAVVPALIALAEQRRDLSGREALEALVVGYEIAARAGLALHATVSDYHTSGAWNALGVAAMAARLRGQSADQLRDALGIAEYHGPRSQMMREIANPTMLHDGSGMGALIGLSAALLAERGFEGAPAITIEAPEVAGYWADLGANWTIEQQYIKPYPVCRWAHGAIDAARAIRPASGLAAGDVEKITIGTFDQAAALYPGMPETTSKAQYSLRFAVATMLVHGQVGAEHVSGAGLGDQAVAALLPLIEVVPRERHNDRFPSGRWADVTIHLKSGGVLESGDTNARGGPEAPLTQAELEDKFMAFAGRTIGEARAREIIDVTGRLIEPDSRFDDLVRLILPPAIADRGDHR